MCRPESHAQINAPVAEFPRRTLEEVVASKPTRDYDPVYGSTTGFWKTDKFVEAVYKSLSGEK